MSKEEKCCDAPDRKTPSEVRKTGLFIVTETRQTHYTEGTAECKKCGRKYSGNDHPGYHFNYWSWR